MKKIMLIATLCVGVNGVGSVLAQELKEEVQKVEEDQPKFSGLYIGAGVNVNHDRAKLKNKETWQLTEEAVNNVGIESVPSGTNLSTCEDVSYGAHAVVGCGYLCNNGLYVALEQEFGWARHPNKVTSYFKKESGDTRIVKSIELATLARFGYRLDGVPGVVYLSIGGRAFRIDKEIRMDKGESKGKTIFRPTFGFGYQHAISTQWSMRGDIMYTHVRSVNFRVKQEDLHITCKAKGHRISGAITFVYTF